MYMRSIRLILCLLYGLDFAKTLDFSYVGASTLPDLKSNSLKAKLSPDRHLVPNNRSDSNSKMNFETKLKPKSAYLPNESMGLTDKFRKPKRSEFETRFVEDYLETTNLESEGKAFFV